MFTGYTEDLQLQPRFAAGELEIGLIAVMEELEARSQVKISVPGRRCTSGSGRGFPAG
jgi:hypothetical protein